MSKKFGKLISCVLVVVMGLTYIGYPACVTANDTNQLVESNTLQELEENDKVIGDIDYSQAVIEPALKKNEMQKDDQNLKKVTDNSLKTQQVIKELKNNDTESIIEVPQEGLYIRKNVVMGIAERWFNANITTEKPNLKITIPENITEIGERSFGSNRGDEGSIVASAKYNLVGVDFSQAESLHTIKNEAFNGCKSLIGEISFPDSLRIIEKFAFFNCESLEGIYLPMGLKKLGDEKIGRVFENNTALKFVRVKGNTLGTVVLPNGLELIGPDTFEDALTYAIPSKVIIPASVTFVGGEAFRTPAVTTIIVKSTDVRNYEGKAFISADQSSNSYGLNSRMTVFHDSNTYSQFKKEGLKIYQNSLTYEYTLKFGENGESEKRLNGQAIKVIKVDDTWISDDNYSLPEVPDINAPLGYSGGWLYEDTIATPNTVIKIAGDEVELSVGLVLAQPTVKFMVDGKEKNINGTYPKINLSLDKEHKIGVDVSHPLEQKSDDSNEGYVEFKYLWTDVLTLSGRGPRQKETGFGSLYSGKPTISINGKDHERTVLDGYINEEKSNYGHYLVEIHGYFVSENGAKSELFYKSASTILGHDPDRTVNTEYIFDVITSKPAQKPNITIINNDVIYGYENAVIRAEVQDIEGQTNTYQWYEASKAGQTTDGTPIDGAVLTNLDIENGKASGGYHYYLEVISTKALNGDVLITSVPVEFKVNKAESSILINDILDKIYDGIKVKQPQDISQTGSQKIPTYRWFEEKDNNWVELDKAPGDAGRYKVVAILEGDENYNAAMNEKLFVISQAKNKWVEELRIDDWTYNEKPSSPVALSKFGEVVYSYSNQESGTYTSEVPVTSGTWYVKATVEATKDFTALEAIKQLTIKKAIPEFEIPTGLITNPDQTLGNIELPKGFTWDNEFQSVGDIGQKVFKATYTPADTQNYEVVTDLEIMVTVVETNDNDNTLIPDENKSQVQTEDISNVGLWSCIVLVTAGLLVLTLKKQSKK